MGSGDIQCHRIRLKLRLGPKVDDIRRHCDDAIKRFASEVGFVKRSELDEIKQKIDAITLSNDAASASAVADLRSEVDVLKRKNAELESSLASGNASVPLNNLQIRGTGYAPCRTAPDGQQNDF